MNIDMSTVVSILGAGLIALLGFVLQEMRSSLKTLTSDVAELKTDMAELKTDMAEVKTDVAEVKSDLAEVKEDLTTANTSLVRIETTQTEHSRRLDRMADQGERISALEGALAVAS